MPEVPTPLFSAAASDALHARAVAFVEAFERGVAMPEPFDALACDLARHQAASGYGRLASAMGMELSALTDASAIPAIPTDAFKAMRVAAHPPAFDAAVFRTSGTTVGARGTHAFRHTITYDRGALAFGRRALAPHLGERFPVLVLGPPPSELPDSSLTHMLAAFVRAFDGAPSPESHFFLRGDTFDLAALDEALASACVQNAPVFLAGTSFAFVHLLDALGEDVLSLPRGSLVMQTGGFKGRSRVVEAAELRRELARVFAVPERAVVAEYGMTELSSQGWEAPLFSEGGVHGTFVVPPWMRVQAADPDTLAPLVDGERGVARITDLLNVDSAVVVQTADLVTVRGASITLHGRAPGAAPRGCSLAIDELLAP
jgi:hypothetical protein